MAIAVLAASVLTGNGTYTIPNGVTEIDVSIIAGGGGGGDARDSASGENGGDSVFGGVTALGGAGGKLPGHGAQAGGAVLHQRLKVEPGQKLYFSVGRGGQGGGGAGAGGDGSIIVQPIPTAP